MTQAFISAITLSSDQASISFTGIPQTGFTDLMVVFSLRDNLSGVSNDATFSVNGSAITFRQLYGTGTVVGSNNPSQIARPIASATSTANTFGNTQVYITNYANTAINKSISVNSVVETNGSEAYQVIGTGVYASNTAVTSITIDNGASNFVTGSTAYLYGISNTTNLYPKATGGIITTDGAYVYHTFAASGTFTPASTMDVDYLVIGGGGGGEGANGGGGGAGGYRTSAGTSGGGSAAESQLSLTGATAYAVTIGGGGGAGLTGSASSISTVSSAGGGGGGYNAGKNGGSGGGAGMQGGAFSGGTGTASQGFAGGSSTSTNAGGGGGAGAVGANGNSTGGAGGAGVTSTISGSSVTRAGGGGGGGNNTGPSAGGAGGAGGGGTGGTGMTTVMPANGQANTGSGGGGGAGIANVGNQSGTSGGSGVVIIRYPK